MEKSRRPLFGVTTILLVALAGLATLAGCGSEGGDELAAIRLVERFPMAERFNEPAEQPLPTPVEWRFDGEPAAGTWSAGPGVTGTRVESGRLTFSSGVRMFTLSFLAAAGMALALGFACLVSMRKRRSSSFATR